MLALKVMMLDSWRKLKHEEAFVRNLPFPLTSPSRIPEEDSVGLNLRVTSH